ncbi:hypothetical protein ACF3OH_12645 [Chryseomicrobium aureum]|uniref:hypothetical protein n=1 Tax=Chryseomicrobium aureum TaxID=1441723 RepID=UPI00370D505C
MGFWYMLGLLIGIGLLLYGIMQSSKKTPFRKISVLMAGTILIGISLYMFTPDSADTVSTLFNL